MRRSDRISTMKRNARKLLAEETVRIIDASSYHSPSGAVVDLRSSIEAMKRGTVCHSPDERDDLVRHQKPESGEMAAVSVVNQTSLQGAMDLLREGADRVVCLNFASAKNPGGGFLGGSEAQEEAICRPSALYASLMTEFASYYELNRRSPNALYTDHAIYSPDVPVFRDEAGNLLEEPYFVSFVTSPAPNRGAVANNSPLLLPDIEAVFRRRIEQVLAVMIVHGHGNLILGAWGCGVFRNNPSDVAAWFRELLLEQKWGLAFERVRFSVLDHGKRGETISAFEKELAVS